MLNIEAMAKLIEEESQQTQSNQQPKPEGAPELTEERAAEMIESAIKSANEQNAETIKGLTETLTAMAAQIEALTKGKEDENA